MASAPKSPLKKIITSIKDHPLLSFGILLAVMGFIVGIALSFTALGVLAASLLAGFGLKASPLALAAFCGALGAIAPNMLLALGKLVSFVCRKKPEPDLADKTSIQNLYATLLEHNSTTGAENLPFQYSSPSSLKFIVIQKGEACFKKALKALTSLLKEKLVVPDILKIIQNLISQKNEIRGCYYHSNQKSLPPFNNLLEAKAQIESMASTPGQTHVIASLQGTKPEHEIKIYIRPVEPWEAQDGIDIPLLIHGKYVSSNDDGYLILNFNKIEEELKTAYNSTLNQASAPLFATGPH